MSLHRLNCNCTPCAEISEKSAGYFSREHDFSTEPAKLTPVMLEARLNRYRYTGDINYVPCVICGVFRGEARSRSSHTPCRTNSGRHSYWKGDTK